VHKILDAQPQALHRPHPRAVEQPGEQGRLALALHRTEQPSDLVDREHGRDAIAHRRPLEVVYPGQVDFKHLAVEIEQRRQGPAMRRRRDMPIGRQMREKALDLRRPHLARMPQPVPADERLNPVDVSLLGS
jgi:hypothetical protein